MNMNLTRPQKLIYDMEKFTGGTIAVLCGAMLVRGEKPLAEIKRAASELCRLNDALRIRIDESEDEVSQVVCDYAERDFSVLRFDTRDALDSYAEKYAKLPLDLHGDLCEINIVILPKQYGLLVKMHHLIGDAWSFALIGTQFNRLLNGETIETYSYADYVASENSYIQGKRYEKDKAYFVDLFKRCDEVTYLNEKNVDTSDACRKTFVIGKADADRIKAYAKAKDTSAFMLFAAVLSVYINRSKMNAERFYIGTAVLNRNGAKEQNTAGMFVNTAPLLIELDNGSSFAENLASIEETVLSVFRHQRFNYSDLLTAIRKDYGFNEKLYDVILSYQNATVAGADVETVWYHSGMQSESLQMHIDDRDRDGIYRIHYDYLTEKFSAQEIEGLHAHLVSLLFDAIRNDAKKLYELDILPPAEKQRLLHTFNDTAAEYPKDKCVHQLFEAQVAKTPHKTALIAADKTLTYAELNAEANRIAHALIESGVGVGDIVAFALPRKSYLVAAMLGILKAGAAYLPLDPSYPQDRIDYMLADSKAKWVIRESNIQALLANAETSTPHVAISSEQLCYCIYTSGSTGMPKGVSVCHRNLINFCSDNRMNNLQHYIAQHCNNVLSCGSITFDISNFEIMLSLLLDKTVVLADEKEIANPSLLSDLIGKNGVDCVHCTPTKIHAYLENKSFASAFKGVQCVMIGGEQLSAEVRDTIKKYCNAAIFNGYGPTETTVGVCFGEVNDSDITIGKPIANTQIYIVDRFMQIVPIGVVGELCIAGDGVGAGYLNRPELTAERFADNPFGAGKLYKTGDLAYWREDGNIAYVGRNDFQVKIRGLRIELGEIENAVCGMDGIAQAVVVVRKDNDGRQLILAFYTGAELDAKEIRRHIGKKLPKYMLPHAYIHLDAMPMTTSGKIDRKALPETDLQSIGIETEYIAPETQMQKELCHLIEAVLGTARVGLADDFFELGGDSLKAIELISKAHNEGIYFNLQNVFDYPTVQALCECIENGDRQAISFDGVDFARVDAVLAKNRDLCATPPQKREVGNILLAGATGYLGMHILADYLENDSGIAYCLVRGEDDADSRRRLGEMLDFYFDGKYAVGDRIAVICADLQKDMLGLPASAYEALAGKVDTVINCAASVKHYGSYKYFYETNVESVKRLLDFCRESHARLIHTSTLSVSGNSFGDTFDGVASEKELHFYESSLYISQPLVNVYARSKFEAEKAVLEAIADGVEANIMRMGNLTSRESDGRFQKNHETNAFLQRVKGVIELGMFPDYLIKESNYAEFTPIDEAAHAVMTIARHFSAEQTVFHINSTKILHFDKLFAYLREIGTKVDIVDGDRFTLALRKTAEQSGMQHIFETFIHDMDESEQLNYDSNIRIENEFTVRYLRALGFEWSDIGIDYLRKYIRYFKDIGYLR